jgi:hypothetical protein
MWPFWRVIAASLLLVRLASAAPASLAELTPGDAGVYVSVEGLSPAVEAFQAGPHFARWRDFPPLAEWTAKHGPAIELFMAEAGRQIGIEPSTVWRDVFGQRILLAAWPAERLGEENGPGLLMVEASNPATLAKLIEGVNQAQTRSGELVEYRERKHAETVYQVRTLRRRGAESTLFLASSDRIAVLTSHEPQMRQVLELLANRPEAAMSLADLPAYRAARAKADPGAPLFAFVNARPWDALIASAPPDGESSGKRPLILDAWRSIECGWLSLRLSPQIELEGRIEIDTSDEQTSLGQWLDRVRRPTTALNWIPADCLAAAAGSLDLAGLFDGHPAALPRGRSDDEPPAANNPPAETSPQPDRAPAVIHHLLHQAFGGVGPGGGLYAARAHGHQADFPLDFVAGLETNHRSDDGSQPLSLADRQAALRSLLLVGASLVNLSQPQANAKVETARSGSSQTYSLAGLPGLPRGWLASFACSATTLVAGTSPQSVERSVQLAADQSLAGSKRLASLLGSPPIEPDELLYVDMRATRQWLSQHAAALAALGADPDEPNRPQAAARQRALDQAAAVLGLADAMVLAIDAQPQSIDVRFVLHIDEPPAR